jgi:hypothetical protein
LRKLGLVARHLSMVDGIAVSGGVGTVTHTLGPIADSATEPDPRSTVL